MALIAAHNPRLETPELLLENLVRAVQIILDVNISRISVYSFKGGLDLIHSRVKQILKHGSRIDHHLIFNQPSFASFDTWLENSLLEHSLQRSIKNLSQRKIQRSYHDWGYLRYEKLFQYFLDCLQVLSTRDFRALNSISTFVIEQRGTYSHPINFTMSLTPVSSEFQSPLLQQQHTTTTTIQEINQSSNKTIPSSQSSQTFSNMTHPIPITISSSSPMNETPRTLESILEANQTAEEEDLETELSPAGAGLGIPKFSYSYGSPIVSVPDFSQLEDTPRLDPALMKSKKSEEPIKSPQTPTYAYAEPGTKSFLESGGYIQPPALGNFPLPQKGQSLKEFLSSLSDASQPELDRENSHFNISEALISAFESMKVKQKLEELQEQRHLERMESMFGTTSSRVGCGSRTYKKKFTLKQRPELTFTEETEESEFEFWRQNRHPPPEIKKKPRILPKIGSDGRSESLISTTEATTSCSQSLSSSSEDINSCSYSAENVALNLLRKVNMKEGKLPEASKLQWLVTERDCPQSLLPMPKNWNSNSESETSSYDESIRLRGTDSWAPPRPQIIFTIHPPPNLQSLMQFQKYRCAGCGVKVQPKYASTYRFCHYLGRYFCSGCHSKKTSRLPQNIIHRWDFSYYQVSNFSATLLDSLRYDPVYNVQAINPGFARKGRIAIFRTYRLQLKFLGEYLQNCKAAIELYEDLNAFPTYYVADPDLYSLEDLIQLRFGTGLPLKVKEILNRGIQHVLQCPLCRQLGFHCEICKSPEVIFPFNVSRVSRCVKCSACFHIRCFNPGLCECPKCLRLVFRKKSLGSSSTENINFNELPV